MITSTHAPMQTLAANMVVLLNGHACRVNMTEQCDGFLRDAVATPAAEVRFGQTVKVEGYRGTFIVCRQGNANYLSPNA